MRILHVIPSLDSGGASKQLEMLAFGLHRQGHQVEVCQFGRASAVGARMEQAGIIVHSLCWTRRIDPVPLWRLHGILRDARPDVIHVWGKKALRIFALVGRKLLGRVVLSRPFAWDRIRPTSSLDRWLFRKVARIIVQGEAEASLGKGQGLYLEKIAVVPPGIATEAENGSQSSGTGTDEWLDWTRKIVCVGSLERHKGFRNAVWTFDFLKFVFDDLHLIFVGDGPDEGYLRQIARNARRDYAIHFLQLRAGQSTASYLAQADVCWIPSLRGGGTQAALEAMLAGRPVIASHVPSLDGLIVDGHSGFVIPPDDRVSLARRTRQILVDTGLAESLGTQARRRALQHFSAQSFVERCQRTYLEAAG
jgi:glycosyltransferase involved in cell wall biosynthesis